MNSMNLENINNEHAIMVSEGENMYENTNLFQEASQSMMGTTIRIGVQASNTQFLLDTAFAKLADYEQRFSANNPNSELMKINRQAGLQAVHVDSELFELIQIGQANSLIDGSLLNIAIGPLIQEWHIGFSDAQQPSEQRIQELLQRINPKKILLDQKKQTVFLSEKGMAIDLGALAKGYFADKIISYFKHEGAECGYIDLGGNILTFGESFHEDGLWRIGIQNPKLSRGNLACVLCIQNQSVVTSGIYERKLEINSKTYHHIFDSHTGYPVKSDVVSLTIVSDFSLTGEVWTTRLFGKNATETLLTLNQRPEIEGVVITTQNDLAASMKLTGKIEYQ